MAVEVAWPHHSVGMRARLLYWLLVETWVAMLEKHGLVICTGGQISVAGVG